MRGPTRLISPFSTFHNCGSSSKLVFLRSAPKRVILGSFSSLKLISNSRNRSGLPRRISSASTRIVRSLNASNSLLSPITRRRWKAGPPSKSRTTIANKRINGPSKSKRNAAPRMSMVLFRIRPLRVIDTLVHEAASIRSASEETATSLCSRCYRARAGALLERLQVGFHHHLDQLLEAHYWFPAQHSPGFRGVTAEVINLSGADQLGIDLNILLPIQTGAVKRDFHKLLHAVGLTGRDYEIVSLRLLQHHPHGFYVIAGKAPIALGIEVSHFQLVDKTELDLGHMLCDFASHEFGATPRRLVVETNRRAGKDPITLAIVDREMMPEDFGHSVRAAGMERRQLGLGLLPDFAKHLRTGSLKKLGLG